MHLLRYSSGRVVNLILTPGNWADRELALALVQGVDGRITIGDLGSRGAECAVRLAADAEMRLITRERVPADKFLLSRVRQGSETTFSQL